MTHTHIARCTVQLTQHIVVLCARSLFLFFFVDRYAEGQYQTCEIQIRGSACFLSANLGDGPKLIYFHKAKATKTMVFLLVSLENHQNRVSPKKGTTATYFQNTPRQPLQPTRWQDFMPTMFGVDLQARAEMNQGVRRWKTDKGSPSKRPFA